MNTELHFSSKDMTWETPQAFYDELNKEFNFTLDPCCTKETAKCEKFYTPIENGLFSTWCGERVFMNPPYGREIVNWVERAYNEHDINGTLIVGLLPARTDTQWFHRYIYNKTEIRFIKGRLKFGNSKNSAPFPSMVVIWGNK